MSSKLTVSISFGKDTNPFNFKYSAVIVQLQKVNQFTTDVDVLNYIASLGWSLIITHPNINSANFVLCFKKKFDKAELVNS